MGKIRSLLKEVEEQRARRYSIALNKSKEREIAEPRQFFSSYTLIIAALLVINFILAGFILTHNVKFKDMALSLKNIEASKRNVTNEMKSTDARILAFDSRIEDLEMENRNQNKSIFDLREADKTLSYRLNMLGRDVDSLGSKTSKKR